MAKSLVSNLSLGEASVMRESFPNFEHSGIKIKFRLFNPWRFDFIPR